MLKKPGADENDDDPDTQINMNMLIQKLITDNIESKKSHSYDIDKQCLKQLLDATNVGTKSIPNTRFKKQQENNLKTDEKIGI